MQHTLGDQAVEVLEVGALEAEVAATDIVNGLVVDHEGAVGMLQGGVGSEDRVVRLDDGVGHRGGGVHAKLQFRLLAVVSREAFENEGTEAGTSSTAERVEHEEALETIAVVRQTTNLVHDDINLLLANGVVTTGVVVGGILLSGDEGLWVEEGAVGARADLVDDVGLEIYVERARDVFAGAAGGESQRND